jgi:hypothetical protein
MESHTQRNKQATREALYDDPFVSDADYGTLVEQAIEDDETEALRLEREEYRHDEELEAEGLDYLS